MIGLAVARGLGPVCVAHRVPRERRKPIVGSNQWAVIAAVLDTDAVGGAANKPSHCGESVEKNTVAFRVFLFIEWARAIKEK